ncbi:MAG: TolC family protein [Calditrichia bacterium]
MASRTWSLLIAAIVLIGGAQAESYDLTQILKLAEQNNKQIQLAKADLKTASAEKLGAFSRALPEISLNAGYNRNLQENLFFFEAPDPLTGETVRQSFKASFRNEFQMNAVLRQTLFSFEVGMAIQAARYFDRMTELSYERTRQEVMMQVKTAFYGVLLAKNVLEVAKDSEVSARENYENLKTKFDAGVLSEYDLLQAEVRWQISIPQTYRASQEYESALNGLKVLVGVPINEELTLDGGLATYPAMPAEFSVENAKEKRTDYNAMLWERKLREKNVSAQKADFFPSLEGSFTYTYSAASDQFKLEQDNDNYIIGLSLNIPIFSGGNRVANVRRASADVDRVTTRIQLAEDNIEVELENLALRLKEAMQRIRANEVAVSTARRTFEIAQTRVDNGLSTQVELKDSRVALDQAQVNYYSAIYDYLRAYFEWELATGSESVN